LIDSIDYDVCGVTGDGIKCSGVCGDWEPDNDTRYSMLQEENKELKETINKLQNTISQKDDAIYDLRWNMDGEFLHLIDSMLSIGKEESEQD
jgi:hypothetical protein